MKAIFIKGRMGGEEGGRGKKEKRKFEITVWVLTEPRLPSQIPGVK